MTEGERGTFGLTKCYFFEKYYYAGSFHHFAEATCCLDSHPGGRLFCVHTPEKIISSVYRMLRNIEEISLDKIQKSDLT